MLVITIQKSFEFVCFIRLFRNNVLLNIIINILLDIKEVRLNDSLSSSHENSSLGKFEKSIRVDGPPQINNPRPSHFLTVINAQSDINMPNTLGITSKKPRGSLNYNSIQRPQMTVDRMDSIKSMKNNMLMDPFMRTNQRLDSIGSIFNKPSNNNYNYAGFPSYISQTSNRFNARDTPIFRNDGVSRQNVSEKDDRSSVAFNKWDKRDSGGNISLLNVGRNPLVSVTSPMAKDPFSKSEVSAVSMNEIMEFEDYIPFHPTYNLEQIDEEKAVGLEVDLEEIKTPNERMTGKVIFDHTLVEARMSDEESYDSKDESEENEESDDESDNESEYRDNLKVEASIRPRKSSTFNSSHFQEMQMKFQTKFSTIYRQGTGNSDMTVGNSQKGGVLTSICTSKDGTKSEGLINPVSLRQKIK